jgi:glycosyltransferase involved in cell wall biosynthesis
MSENATKPAPVRMAYIGCWYKNDMYSHNCSGLVDSLRDSGMKVDVITSNCRCFSSAQKFGVSKDELISLDCTAVTLPHAPRNPGTRHGVVKQLVVKMFRLDLWLAILRGFLFYRRARHADVIHFDQVLEAFGCVPFFVLVALASVTGKRVVVTVHEIDPFQREHKWLNRLYGKCAEILVYSEDMKKQLAALGAPPDKVSAIKYGTAIPELGGAARENYLFFGGHNIQRGKGYVEFLDALALLKSRDVKIHTVIYVGHGCNGLKEAKDLANSKHVSDVIEWQEFYTKDELPKVYQASKVCVVPFTGGSARHPLTCAMVNATPVIATRKADIPEYLGDLGIYVDGSANSIADAICRIEEGAIDLTALGKNLRAKAMAELDYHKIAEELSGMYAKIGGKKSAEGKRLLWIPPNMSV